MLSQFKENEISDWMLAFLHKWYIKIVIPSWWYLEMGSVRGHGSGALENGISAVTKETAQSSLAPPPVEDTASRQLSAACKKASSELGPYWHSDLRLPASEERMTVFGSHPVSVLCYGAELAKTLRYKDYESDSMYPFLRSHRHRCSLVLSNPPSETCTGDIWWEQ